MSHGARGEPIPRGRGHLEWHEVVVQGRPAHFGSGGRGIPVVFLHGWALGPRSYRRALRRLGALGCRVHAPALPGFGGTPDLEPPARQFGDHAEWLDEFVRTARVRTPYVLIGHSFGGGVAVASAHRSPALVRQLVLLNSIGGPAGTSVDGSPARSLRDRTLLEWALAFPRDLMPLSEMMRTLPALAEDALPNVVRNPVSLWRTAELARAADLSTELAALRRQAIPVKVIGASEDRVVPMALTEALARALRADVETVPGGHCWLLASPDEFAERMSRVFRELPELRELKGSVGRARPSTVPA